MKSIVERRLTSAGRKKPKTREETDALERASALAVISVRIGYGIAAVKSAVDEYFWRRDANGIERR